MGVTKADILSARFWVADLAPERKECSLPLSLVIFAQSSLIGIGANTLAGPHMQVRSGLTLRVPT